MSTRRSQHGPEVSNKRGREERPVIRDRFGAAAKIRKSLTHVGGPVTTRGEAELSDVLRHALDVQSDDDIVRAHVHGFHSYPARLHPQTAERLLAALGGPNKVVLDPFCGSGTVVVEARLSGAIARGTDVNPLAIRLARLKSRGVVREDREILLATARDLERHTTARRNARAQPSRRYGAEDIQVFPPHILLELDGLRDGLDRLGSQALREDLELVLSAILTKVSTRVGDTATATADRRLPGGYVSHLFVRKTEELVRALAQFEHRVPARTPPPDLHLDDAKTLGTLGAATVDLVVSSPPYAATYDYLAHHALRLRWLGLRADRFETLELGARRNYLALGPQAAEQRWRNELGGVLAALARVLRKDALAVLMIGDSAVASRALRADQLTEELAGPNGLATVAVASQLRPHFHSATQRAFALDGRREHLIAVRRL